MRHFILILLMALTFSSQAAIQSEFYDPDLLLDSIVSPKEQKVVYQFDQWGNITLEESYLWSAQDNDWEGIFKMKFSFDQEGNETLYESYTWDEDAKTWVGSVKSEYEYHNDKMVHATMYEPDIQTDTWIPYMDNYFAYDEAGNDTYYEYNIWSEEKNDWEPQSKFIYEYNDKNFLILAESWNWDSDMELWIGNYKVEKEYSGVLNLMLSDYYIWNDSDMSWQIDTVQEGEWNESHNCWTLTEYSVADGTKYPLRSILYYFNAQSSLSAPISDDKFIDPFEPRFPMADSDKNARVFDLSGRMIPAEELMSMPKGIYIVNGKKVMK